MLLANTYTLSAVVTLACTTVPDLPVGGRVSGRRKPRTLNRQTIGENN